MDCRGRGKRTRPVLEPGPVVGEKTGNERERRIIARLELEPSARLFCKTAHKREVLEAKISARQVDFKNARNAVAIEDREAGFHGLLSEKRKPAPRDDQGPGQITLDLGCLKVEPLLDLYLVVSPGVDGGIDRRLKGRVRPARANRKGGCTDDAGHELKHKEKAD